MNIDDLSKILGSGTYGCVKVIDGNAVKTVTDSSEAEIQQEAELLKQCYLLNSEFFVKLISCDPSQGTITMELAWGDLAKLCKSKVKYDEPTMRRIVKQLVSALKYLHEANVVHADLKPENIMVTYGDDGQMMVKVGDFGQAFIPPLDPYDEQLRGTAEYFPLDEKPTFQSDAWSMGLVIFMVVTRFFDDNYVLLFYGTDLRQRWEEEGYVGGTVYASIIKLLGLVLSDGSEMILQERVNINVFMVGFRKAEQTQQAVSSSKWHSDLKKLVNGLIQNNPNHRVIADIGAGCNEKNNKKRPINPATEKEQPPPKEQKVSSALSTTERYEEQQSPLNVQESTSALSKQPPTYCVIS